ncbi:unnamed protein product [Sphenostylis stenocarpa]|uniref:Uncharacterized protein n=1 Tax=Sphenostylis stenocarpa TaxID=92480 RepID=A0AA87BAS6_9FABA|nr:unnamed protein product [Sphenostylis stenocarpa]
MNIYHHPTSHNQPPQLFSITVPNTTTFFPHSNFLQMEFCYTATTISNHGNKENVPPIGSSYVNKDKSKTPIPHIMSISFKNKKRSTRKLKRLPLADVTNLFNSNATDVFNLSHHQHIGASAILRRTHGCSNTLRMGFR